MIFQILTHTPRWVFAVFALLVWLGAKQMIAGRAGLARVTLLPVAMTSLSAYGIASAFGTSLPVLLGWAISVTTLALFVLQRPLPAGTRYDAGERAFQVRGSAVPLVLMMSIFLTKYAVGVAIAMHPGLRHHADFALGIGILNGAFSGVFVGRAARLWMLAVRSSRIQFGGLAARA